MTPASEKVRNLAGCAPAYRERNSRAAGRRCDPEGIFRMNGIGRHQSARAVSTTGLTPQPIIEALGGWQREEMTPLAKALMMRHGRLSRAHLSAT